MLQLLKCILLFVLAWIFLDFIPKRATILLNSYENLHLSSIECIIIRLIIISIGIFASILLNELISNRKSFITKLGLYSLTIYILHFIIIRVITDIIKMITLQDIIRENIIFSIAYIIITLVLVIFILSRDSFNKYFNKFLNFCKKQILSEDSIK
jgi:fucose 4-O-acetylase-like acetyltransferase